MAMKKYCLWAIAFGLLTVASCKDKKPANGDIITTDYVVPIPSDTPVAMDRQSDRVEVEWIEGRTYTIVVNRVPADSLPMVADEIGQKYKDNLVRVKVMRADSTIFFNRTFTKSAFASWLDADYQENAILEGMRFLKVESDELVLTAWLNHPESGDDEAAELRVIINKNGEVAIQRYNENDRDDLEMMEREEE